MNLHRICNDKIRSEGMARQGFDNDQYLKLQSQHIRERIAQFGGKLYLEFGGKLFDDFHACPGLSRTARSGCWHR